MITVYAITSNNGDGSSSIRFLMDPDLLELLEEHDPEGYGGNEGGYYTLHLATTAGIEIYTRAEVLEDLRTYYDYEG